MIRWLLLLSCGAALHAQPLSYGFKLGVPVTDAPAATPFSTNTQSRWMGGPAVELHLPRRLSVEFSALLRTSTEQSTMSFPLGTSVNPYLVSMTDKVKTWDFPFLLKYRFTQGRVRPFVGAGGAWSYRRSEHLSAYTCMGPQGSCRPPEFPNELQGGIRDATLTKFGPAASAGVEFKTRYVTVAPEVRWNRAFSGAPVRNQFMFGVGFSFGR